MTPDPYDDRIRAAFEELNRLIVERVRREQRRDQLTGLQNERAFDELLKDHIEKGTKIWAAFIEVDKFKSINDKYGYQNADELLKSLGSLLRNLSKEFPGAPDAVQVFRPHGDEFFMVGTFDRSYQTEVLSELLELVREEVGKLRLDVAHPSNAGAHSPNAGEEMWCEVSIGWLVLDDVLPLHTVTVRELRRCLERAVDEAKRDRNRVVRYSSEFRHRRFVASRADCRSCRSKFTVDIPSSENRTDELYCPNCGARVLRPPPSIENSIAPPAEI